MDAFESLIAVLLRRQGYWTRTNFKVELTAAEKRRIGRPSSPRWDLDVIAFKGATNELLAVECKSFLDSPGVKFRQGAFVPSDRYKLFTESTLRQVVLNRLSRQLFKLGAVGRKPRVTLCLAAGHIASQKDRESLEAHMKKNGWLLFDESWILEQLEDTADSAYENDVAHVVAKLIIRMGKANS